MADFLEVIVTSVHDAIEAEAGGADRLELVRALDGGGLTPEIDLVRAVLGAVRLPVRVMLRESPEMSLGGANEMHILQAKAEALAKLPINGLVTGFIKGDSVDIKAMIDVLAPAPGCNVTFHRAFDELPDPLAAIWQLKGFPQIDRILTVGGAGDWPTRMNRLLEWQLAAQPEMKLLVAAGLCSTVLSDLKHISTLTEIHVGRAAREERSVSGSVTREAVRSLKSALG